MTTTGALTCSSVSQRSCSDCMSIPHRTGNSNVLLLFSRAAIASVYVIRSNGAATKRSSRVMHSLSIRSAKNFMSSPRSLSSTVKTDLRNDSARSALSERSAKASSGSIIQNSARCRDVLLFSARKVGPKV